LLLNENSWIYFIVSSVLFELLIRLSNDHPTLSSRRTLFSTWIKICKLPRCRGFLRYVKVVSSSIRLRYCPWGLIDLALLTVPVRTHTPKQNVLIVRGSSLSTASLGYDLSARKLCSFVLLHQFRLESLHFIDITSYFERDENAFADLKIDLIQIQIFTFLSLCYFERHILYYFDTFELPNHRGGESLW